MIIAAIGDLFGDFMPIRRSASFIRFATHRKHARVYFQILARCIDYSGGGRLDHPGVVRARTRLACHHRSDVAGWPPRCDLGGDPQGCGSSIFRQGCAVRFTGLVGTICAGPDRRCSYCLACGSRTKRGAGFKNWGTINRQATTRFFAGSLSGFSHQHQTPWRHHGRRMFHLPDSRRSSAPELFPEVRWATLETAINIDVVQGWVMDTCLVRSPISAAQGYLDCWNAQAASWRRLLLEKRLIIEAAQVDIDGDEKSDRLYRFAIKDRGTCTTIDGHADHLWRYALRRADGDPDRARTFNALAEDGSLLLYIGGPLRNTAYFWHTTGWISYGFTLRPVDRDGHLLAATYGHTQICEFARKTPIRQKH